MYFRDNSLFNNIEHILVPKKEKMFKYQIKQFMSTVFSSLVIACASCILLLLLGFEWVEARLIWVPCIIDIQAGSVADHHKILLQTTMK